MFPTVLGPVKLKAGASGLRVFKKSVKDCVLCGKNMSNQFCQKVADPKSELVLVSLAMYVALITEATLFLKVMRSS